MTRYLLDTSTLIDVSKGREPARSRVQALVAARHHVGVCAVVVSEFTAGLAPHQHMSWAAFLSRLHYWTTTRPAAERAGHYRYGFARRGQAISTGDALIAATAWHWGATIVTANPKDFPMTDVQVVSIRI